MIDVDAELEFLDEIMEVAADPNDVSRVPEIEAILARTDEHGNVPNSAIFVRSLLAGHLTLANADDISPVLGVLAETQQLMRDRADDLLREAFVPILAQMHVTVILLLENPAIPYTRVEPLLEHFEQLCLQVGMTRRGVFAQRMRIAIRRGDHATAERMLAEMQAQPRDTIVIADSVEDVIEWYADRGMDEEALRLYQNASPESETHYWQGVQLAALMPLLRLGRGDQAAYLYDESLDIDEIDSGDAARLTYLARVGRLDDGIALLPQVAAPQDYDTDRSRALVAEHAAVLLGHLRAAGRGAEPVPGMDASVDDLLDRYREYAEQTARTLDEVNAMDVAVPRLHRFWAEHAPAAKTIAQPEPRGEA